MRIMGEWYTGSIADGNGLLKLILMQGERPYSQSGSTQKKKREHRLMLPLSLSLLERATEP